MIFPFVTPLIPTPYTRPGVPPMNILHKIDRLVSLIIHEPFDDIIMVSGVLLRHFHNLIVRLTRSGRLEVLGVYLLCERPPILKGFREVDKIGSIMVVVVVRLRVAVVVVRLRVAVVVVRLRVRRLGEHRGLTCPLL